jgi:hypothetical protein
MDRPVDNAPQSRAAVELESQHHLAQRKLEAAEGLRKLYQRVAYRDMGARDSYRGLVIVTTLPLWY